MLPNASQLTNQTLANIGLNMYNFTAHQIQILNAKGYTDAILTEANPQGIDYARWTINIDS